MAARDGVQPDDAQRADGVAERPHAREPASVSSALLALQRAAGNRTVAALLARRSQAPQRVLARSPAQDAIDRNTNMLGTNLDETALAAELMAALPADDQLVWDVFELLDFENTDDVAYEMEQAEPDDATLAEKLRPHPHLARMLVIRLQFGSTDDAEARAIERIQRAGSAAHDRLASEPWNTSAAVTSALAATGAELQPNTGGSGDLILDEYSIVVEQMPAGLEPEAYLSEMATDLNAAVNSADFDAINTFHRRPQPGNSDGPAVGDVYHIDISGPDNGSVMLVRSRPDHFVFQTVWTSEDGYHPEYGARQFGFTRLAGGAVRWYTKGASRPGLTPASGTIGRHAQEAGWTHLLNGIAAELERRGGTIRGDSFRSWNTHRDDVTSSGRILF